MSGVGRQKAGSTSAGYGTSAEATAPAGAFLRDTTTGRSLGARKIDPATRDYVLDSNGRTLGQHFVRHAVQMSLHTELGSAADGSIGHRLMTLDRITPNFERQVESLLAEAVLPLVRRGLIEVVGFRAFEKGNGSNGMIPGGTFGRFIWRDLTTGQEHPEVV